MTHLANIDESAPVGLRGRRAARVSRVGVLLAGLLWLNGQLSVDAQEANASAPHSPRRYVLIVTGLPGDESHRISFQQTVNTWCEWLIRFANVHERDVTLLSATEGGEASSISTAQGVTAAANRLQESIGEGDALWIFLLGHGSQDGDYGWFHLPGPDLDSSKWADMFANCRASEQVIFLTHSASGSFLKGMSLPGRIVITATDANGEVNETRFPHELARVMRGQLNDVEESPPSDLLSLLQETVASVQKMFETQELAATEHAQLDDNGDGLGTELADLQDDLTQPIDADHSPLVDGVRARRIVFSLQPKSTPVTESAIDAIAESATGPKPDEPPLPTPPDEARE